MGTTRTLPTPKKRLSRTRYENPTGSGGAVNPEKPPRKIILGGFWGIFGLLFWGFRLRHTAPIENTRPSRRPFLIAPPEKPHPRMSAPPSDQLTLLRKLAAGDRVILDPNTQQVMLVGAGEKIDSLIIHPLLRHG